MLIVSGYNVYPAHVEDILLKHPDIANVGVIGIPHPYKMQVAKAIIVLKNGYTESLAIKKSIKELCEKNLARYSLPYEYEFRKSLPRTLIGKVDFNKLAAEELEKGKKNE